MNKKDFQQHNEYFIIKVFIFVFMTLMLFFLAITLYISNRERMNTIETIGSRERLVVEGARNTIQTHINFLTKDLILLKNEFLLALEQNQDYDHIASDWAIYSNERQLYTQLRFIDETGMETIRINTFDDQEPQIVDQQELQDKSDRYYFIETIALSDNSIFYSSFDLNVENGVIDIPYKLEFRLSTPIYVDDDLLGIIIINFNTSYLLNSMPYYNEISQGEFYIMDENGHYIYNIKDGSLYGFDLVDREGHSFSNTYPDVFERFDNDISLALTDDGLFSVETFEFSSAYDSNEYQIYTTQSDLYIVTRISSEVNQYLFKTHVVPTLILISIVDYWIFIIIIILVSIMLTAFIYVRAKLDYEMKFYASVDPLSRLYNRNFGITEMEKMVKDGKEISICFFDLNGLKLINDTFGHETGDNFIKDIVTIVESHISKSDYVFRLGGDEFVIVTTKDEKYLHTLWHQIETSFHEVNATHTKIYELSASHGIISYNENMEDVNHFISIADHLMYEDKKTFYKNKKS